MTQPSQLLNRIRRQKSARPAPAQAAAPHIPAPVPAGFAPQAAPAPAAPAHAPAPPQPVAPSEPVAPPQPARITPRPVGGHALYSELMRSHDRMGTRHLKDGG